ncbi:acylneuraminate cytidylyltransferase family protein [bacterium]|nr:acylneuraminate cytidylyltransferase family protein [bacterium]
MSNNRNFVALIPARGGSQRLPNKNMLAINGTPLIAMTINSALEADQLNDVFVSTDCSVIAECAKKYHAKVPFIRPDSLSNDTATSNSVILHFIDKLELLDSDIVVFLQPTSPLRTFKDINNAINLFIEKNADGVVSVTECEHSPLWCNTLPDSLSLGGFLPRNLESIRSQDLPQYYRLNGAIYIFKVGFLKKNNGIKYNDGVFAFVMEKSHSIDIDTELDFKIVKTMLINDF